MKISETIKILQEMLVDFGDENLKLSNVEFSSDIIAVINLSKSFEVRYCFHENKVLKTLYFL